MAASKCYLTTTTGSDSWPEETRGVVFVSEGRLRGNSALCLNHCHAVILWNRGQRCMLYLCLNNMQFFLPIWWFMFVRLRACEGNTHTHTSLFWYCTPVVFSPSFSIMPPPSMNKGFVWIFLRLSAVQCYPGFALCFLAWVHSWFLFLSFFFFNLSFTKEIISD